MRQAGTIESETHARRFTDYLLTLGVIAQVEREPDGWAVWVRDENHLNDAKRQLQQFLSDPDDPRYRDVANQASQIRREATRKADQARRNVVDVRGRWNRLTSRRAPLTFTIIGICVAVFLWSEMGSTPNRNATMRTLGFVDVVHQTDPNLDLDANRWDRLIDIRRGQIWRLITPIFLHMSIWHIAFNMYALYLFGSLIESRKGSLLLVLMVVVIGVISNVAEAVVESAYFGGMSGVVYGLFGYAWMKSTYDPGSGIHISRFTVALLLIWFFVCFTGWLGPIANTAHGAGLVVGVAWGYAPVLRETLQK
jgi:GlpG protein